jgi:Mycothiol maleylpyruvate isomerase N-terminal domain
VNALAVPHEPGRDAFVAGLDAFAGDVAGRDERALLAASRCTGWTVLDVAVHVHIGLQDMLLGVVSPTSEPPDVDAATYWRSFPPGPSDDVFAHTRFVRAVASAYRRPSAAVAHVGVTVAALRRAASALPECAVAFQGHVLTTGDFLATWAVELAVHHLDVHGEPAPQALALSRATVEALAGSRAPADVDDSTLVLAGAGRLPPARVTGWDAQLPVFG